MDHTFVMTFEDGTMKGYFGKAEEIVGYLTEREMRTLVHARIIDTAEDMVNRQVITRQELEALADRIGK